jgi:hypothetical protein
MDKLLFWLGIGAAQKAVGSKLRASNRVVSLVVGALVAALIGVVAFLALVSQKL